MSQLATAVAFLLLAAPLAAEGAPATGFVISFLRWAPGLPRRPRARLP
jgi:hypothetical protein